MNVLTSSTLPDYWAVFAGSDSQGLDLVHRWVDLRMKVHRGSNQSKQLHEIFILAHEIGLFNTP